MDHLLTIKEIHIEGLSDDIWLPIVKGIDLNLDKGEVLGLIGESGAGKSTLGLASMAYTRMGCRITSGSIVFDGIELTKASSEELRKIRGIRIAYVAQSAAASFNPAHRLIKQCIEAPVKHGLSKPYEAKQKSIDLFRRLLLPDPQKIGYRFPHQVSGGQLQRAMVAMAMSCYPDMIIFDEPTTALDVTTQIEVLTAIKEITRQIKTAAIYITHDLAIVAQLADRIMVLRNGELVEKNTTREMLDRPQEEYTRQLLSVRSLRVEKELACANENTILEVENVSASYIKGVKVLDDVSLKVCSSRTVAVVGESGSGKSTLARVITGLLTPIEGRVSFKDEELSPCLKSRNKESLRCLQMIYQMPDTALNPRHKVKTILGRPLEFYFNMNAKERESRIIELLNMTELPEKFIARYPAELSGGEKQRVCIARALAAKPDLILCDEVTSALDQLVGEEILELLQNLQNELGISYLFITHDLATVKAIADEVVVMLEGRIVEQGEKQKILSPPHHEYTELLLSSVPEMDPDWLDHLLDARSHDHHIQG